MIATLTYNANGGNYEKMLQVMTKKKTSVNFACKPIQNINYNYAILATVHCKIIFLPKNTK